MVPSLTGTILESFARKYPEAAAPWAGSFHLFCSSPHLSYRPFTCSFAPRLGTGPGTPVGFWTGLDVLESLLAELGLEYSQMLKLAFSLGFIARIQNAGLLSDSAPVSVDSLPSMMSRKQGELMGGGVDGQDTHLSSLHF